MKKHLKVKQSFERTMKARKVACTSCKTDISVVKKCVSFKCPQCGKEKITRCGKCRRLSVPYICPGCGFEGP